MIPMCIVTGCALIDGPLEDWCWGDLHEVGGTYVFNAVLDEGETAWHPCGKDSADWLLGRPVATVSGDYFERRGVIVMSSIFVELNEAARARLEWTP